MLPKFTPEDKLLRGTSEPVYLHIFFVKMQSAV